MNGWGKSEAEAEAEAETNTDTETTHSRRILAIEGKEQHGGEKKLKCHSSSSFAVVVPFLFSPLRSFVRWSASVSTSLFPFDRLKWSREWSERLRNSVE